MVKNHHLAKSITNASWNGIIQYTMYKAESTGTFTVLIYPRYTSQERSYCGNIKHDLNLSDRKYHCEACNITIDRDLNAAINIRRKGIDKFKEQINVGRGPPKVTTVKIRLIPGKAIRWLKREAHLFRDGRRSTDFI